MPTTTGLVDGSIVLEPESILVKELRSVEAEVEELRRTKAQLEVEVEALRGVKTELQNCIDRNIDGIDLGTLVNRTLTKLKVGSQSPQGKAIKTFVKDLQVELARLPIPQDQVVPKPAVSKKGRSSTPTQWEDKVEIALGGLNWNG